MAANTRDIAGYRQAELIGRGGFASVYRATDAAHGRDVAIKVLLGTLGEAERRRFDRERQTMGRLGSHPNIIAVHESGYTEAGEGYIVMELATGGSLRDRLERDGRMPWDEAVRIMAAIAGAAQAAHDQGVLHRDIKPDNILIDAYGHPKLTDFGIAAVASNATATTSTTATVAHAAPEVLQGQTGSPAVDIYAVGSTLYNLITGWPPFQRADDQGVSPIITRVLGEQPPDLRAIGVPDAAAAVAERALAKTPQERQANAAILSADLLASIDGAGPVPAGPDAYANAAVASPPGVGPSNQAVDYQAAATRGDASPQPSSSSTRSRPAFWLALAAVVAVVAVIGAGAYVMASQSDDAAAGPNVQNPDDVLPDAEVGARVEEQGDDVLPDAGAGAGSDRSTPPETPPPTSLPDSSLPDSSPFESLAPDPRENAVPDPEVATGPDFSGVYFDTPLSWTSTVGQIFTADIITEGLGGEMVVGFYDVDGFFNQIVQDLQLIQFPNGTWAYEGSNPRLTLDDSLADYSPDTLTMYLATDGLWYLDQVCNTLYGCVFIDQ